MGRDHGRVEPRPTTKFLADVYARTDAAATARYAWELRFVGSSGATWDGSDGVLLMREQGAFDRVAQRLSSETVLFERDGRGSQPLVVVIDSDALYIRPGFLAAGLGFDPDHWIGTSRGPESSPHDDIAASVSLGKNAPAGVGPRGVGPRGVGPRGVGASGLLGPVLLDVVGEVTIVGEVGAARVRGEPTTHLRAHVAGSALAAAVPAVTAPGGGMASDTVVMDIWIDGDGRLRRMQARVGQIALQVDLYDYGEPVDVDVPTEDRIVASDVELLTQLLTRLGTA